MARKSTGRAGRWNEATSNLRAALEKASEALAEAESARDELKSVQEEYEEWKDNLPENLQTGAMAEKLEAVCDLDLDGMDFEVLSELESVMEEAENADLPLGFGRD